MHYIIDGYNMLFAAGRDAQQELEQQRQSLIDELTTIANAFNNSPLTVIFDAHSQPGSWSRSHRSQLEIVYTDEGETADAYILEMVGQSRYPHACTVVTRDGRLALKVHHLGGKSSSPTAFLRQAYRRLATKEAEPSEALSWRRHEHERENARWMRLFEKRLNNEGGNGA